MRMLSSDGWFAIDPVLLECPICCKVYTDVPIITGCGHTLCEECVHSIQMEEGDDVDICFRCPMCMQVVLMTQKNYLIGQMIQHIREIPRPQSPTAHHSLVEWPSGGLLTDSNVTRENHDFTTIEKVTCVTLCLAIGYVFYQACQSRTAL